jgi:exosortase A
MNGASHPLHQDGVIGDSDTAHAGWRVVLPLLAAVMVTIIALYWRTAESMIATWSRSETFAHGYLIVPIAVFLVWRQRHRVAGLPPRPDYVGFVFLAIAGFVWLVAAAGHAKVVQQYAMVAMLPAAVVALAGRHVALALAFPLAFLLFAVPVGEALLPLLTDWTARFTVGALRLSGIPVYQEGNFFSLPSGRWSVVEACSGLRYLIASITVGALYGYLTYQRLWKRLVFVGLSVLAPIVANWLRAYMIVMIGHLSDMKLAVGIDHFIYGWVFFGVVIVLLFWLGGFLRDPVPGGLRDGAQSTPQRAMRTSRAGLAASAVSAVAVAAGWPLYAAHLDRLDGEGGALVLVAPAGVSGWSVQAMPMTDWRPRYGTPAASLFEVYRKGERRVAVYIAFYRHQKQGAKLITSQNVLVEPMDPAWGNVGSSSRSEDLGAGAMDIRQTQLRSVRQRLLVWDWYRVSGRDLGNPYLAKALLARDRLLGRGDDAAAIILAASYDLRPETAEEALRQFAREMLPSIDSALARAAAGDSPPAQGAR